MKESVKFLFLILIVLPHLSIAQAIPPLFNEERINNISEIVPLKNQGFFKYKVIDAGEVTVFEAAFYNLEATQMNSKKIELPRCMFIGFANNGTLNHFLFYSKINKEFFVAKFDNQGKFVTNLLFNVKVKIKMAELFYYDSINYYTYSKDHSSVTFTKHNYNNDTIWQRKIKDNGETILFHDAKKAKNLYISLSIPKLNSRILGINDISGEILFDKRAGNDLRARTVQSLIVEGENIVLAGEEFSKRTATGIAEGLYITKLDDTGGSKMDKFYSWSKINYSRMVDSTQIGTRLDKIFLRELIKSESDYKLLVETALRVDKIKGEGFAIQLASIFVLAPFGSSMLGNYEQSKIATVDFFILTADTKSDSLILQQLPKAPIVRKYNFDTGPAQQGRHFFLDKYKMFDYRFKNQQDNLSYELFYYQNLTGKQFTLAKASIQPRGDVEVTKVPIDIADTKPDFFNIYPLSDELVLIESNTKNSDGYNIINLSQFK